MTNFVEQAVLKVVDQSSPQIAKINAELKKLQATAKSLKSTKIDLGLKDSGLARAVADVKRLESELRRLKSVAINVRVDTGRAMAQLNQLQQAARRPLTSPTAALQLARTTRELEKRNEAQKAGIPIAIAAGRFQQKETALQKVHAKAVQDMLDRKTADTKATAAQIATTAKLAKQQAKLGDAAAERLRQVTMAKTKETKAETDYQKAIAHSEKNFKDSKTRTAAEAKAAADQRVRETRAAIVDAKKYRAVIEGAGAGGLPPPSRPPRGAAAPRGGAPEGRGIVGGAFATAGGIATYTAMIKAWQAVKEGTKQADLGDVMLSLRDLTPDRRKLVEQMTDRIIADSKQLQGGAFYQRGQIQRAIAENLGVTREGAAKTPEDRKLALEATEYLTARTMELARLREAQGASESEAFEDALKFSKALEAQDWITDLKTGKFSIQRANEGFDFVASIMKSVGMEMSGAKYLQMVKNLRGAKFGLSQEGVATSAFLFEEMGPTAAVSMRSMIQQLQGFNVQVTSMREQAALGLGTLYKEGKQTKIRPKPEFAQMIRERPLEAFEKFILPGWERVHPKEMKQYREAVDAGDASRAAGIIQELVSKLASQPLARDMAAALALRLPELKQQLEDWRTHKGDVPTIREQTADSVTLMMRGLTNQFQGVLGESVKALAPLAQTMVEPMTGYLTDMQKEIARRRAAGEPLVTAREAALGTIGGLAAAPVVGGVSALIGKALSTVTSPLGYAAGMQGMMARDPATRTLSAAGVSLLAAGNSLQNAASGFALIGPAIRSALTTGALAAAFLAASTRPAGGPSNLPDLDNLAKANNDYAQSLHDLQAKQEELSTATDPEVIKRLNAEIETAQQRFDKANRVFKDAETAAKLPPLPKEAPPLLPTLTVKELNELQELRRLQQRTQGLGEGETTKPPPPVINLDEIRVETEKLSNLFGTGSPFATSIGTLSTTAGTFTSSLGTLPTFAETFASTFSTGTSNVQAAAGTLTSAGQTAADIITSGAGSAGAAYGDAAVARIQSAVASISVNVNTPAGTKVDTGDSKAAG